MNVEGDAVKRSELRKQPQTYREAQQHEDEAGIERASAGYKAT